MTCTLRTDRIDHDLDHLRRFQPAFMRYCAGICMLRNTLVPAIYGKIQTRKHVLLIDHGQIMRLLPGSMNYIIQIRNIPSLKDIHDEAGACCPSCDYFVTLSYICLNNIRACALQGYKSGRRYVSSLLPPLGTCLHFYRA